MTSFSCAEIRASDFVPELLYPCYTLKPCMGVCLYLLSMSEFCQSWWRRATSKWHSFPQSALIISGSCLLCVPLQAVSTSFGLRRAGLLWLLCPIRNIVCCPAQHNCTKNIALGCKSDLLGVFNHLPIPDFSTFTATKHAGPRVEWLQDFFQRLPEIGAFALL